MKKASIGIAAILVVLLVLAIAISLNITGGTTLVGAVTEVCNDEDDDGDSYVDEYDDPKWGILYEGQACNGIGECGLGLVECKPITNEVDCSTNPGGSEDQSEDELCDDKDHDCNGNFYNGFYYNDSLWGLLEVGQACNGIGECGLGLVECFGNYIASCSTNPGGSEEQNTTEICDDKDNDCDGDTDEGGVCPLREIAYDDGRAENAWAWTYGGNMWAVRFTPTEYPSTLKIAKFYIGEDWPDPGNDNFNVSIFDDDGVNGTPGTLLGGINSGTITTAWVNVDISLPNITIEEGDFYIALVQVGDFPNCVGMGTDESEPWAQRSWRRNIVGEEDWEQLDISYGNMMIRAIVEAGPIGHLEPYLISPTEPINVTQDQFFNFTTGVKCVGGNCGNVTAILDPEEVKKLENKTCCKKEIGRYDEATLEKIVPDKSPEQRLKEINEKIKEKGAKWKAGLTPKALLSIEEKRMLLGSYMLPEKDISKEVFIQTEGQSYPSSFDWRDKDGIDWMTPVKDQGNCGSCWAFSTVGTVEPAFNIYNNDPDPDFDLSEQQLVSNGGACCDYCGDCNGGGMSEALEYIRDTGITDEDCFSYLGCKNWNSQQQECIQEWPCDLCADWEERKHHIVDYFYVTPNTQEAYKQALMDYGPLSIGIDADDMFLYYVGGIYEELEEINFTGLNHGIVLVGWDDIGGYWIIKNSWNTTWGENGYAKMAYGDIEKYDYALAVFETNKVKGIVPMNSGSPFYTIDQNPTVCENMQNDSVCETTWQINATGDLGTYKFFTVYKSDYDRNKTEKVNITIVETAEFISITLSGYPIDFGSLDPGTSDNPATGNSGNQYYIAVNPETTINVDLYQEGGDFTSGGSIFGIGNMTCSLTNNPVASLPVNETYDSAYPIAVNIPADTNTTMYYWLDIPGGKTAGAYNSSINIKAVQTGTSP